MRIFWEVDAQNDFMNSDGALYVPGAETIKKNLNALTITGLQQSRPMLGSVDTHFGTKEYENREGELSRYGGPFPDHCIKGTKGQERIRETYLMGADRLTFIPHILEGEQDDKLIRAEWLNRISKQEVFFEKQSYDVFTNPDLDNYLKILEVDEAVVYGVATDYCVKAAVLGMQERGIQTYVVSDAIKGITPEGEQSALEEMAEAGAQFVTTKQVVEGRI